MRNGRGSGEKEPTGRMSSADIALEEALHQPSQYIDTLTDTQSEPAALAIDAGVSDLKVLYHDGKVALPVHLTIQTSTGLHRGVHMSRLVHAASAHDSPDIISWLRRICKDVNRSQPGSSVTCAFELPYTDRVHPRLDQDEPGRLDSLQVHREGDDGVPLQQEDDRRGPHAEGRDRDDDAGAQARRHAEARRQDGGVLLAIPTEKMKRVEEARKDPWSPGPRPVRRGPCTRSLLEALPQLGLYPREVLRVDTRPRRDRHLVEEERLGSRVLVRDRLMAGASSGGLGLLRRRRVVAADSDCCGRGGCGGPGLLPVRPQCLSQRPARRACTRCSRASPHGP